MNMFKEALYLWRRTRGERAVSLQLRLFAFLSLFVIVLALATLLVMTMTGFFNIGAREYRVWMERELGHLSEVAAADFGKLSFRGVEFAGQLSAHTDDWLRRNGISAGALRGHPEMLEEFLSTASQPLLSLLQNNKCTGAFIVLDASAKPDLPDTESSRAGVFFKRTEPNVIDLIGSKIYCLRGPARVARINGVELMARWETEFGAADMEHYAEVFAMARNHRGLTPSRLYRWTGRALLKGNSSPGMLLCIPLVAYDGTVYGVCGLEVSAMLFKLQYSPDNTLYPHIFATLSRVRQGTLDTGSGLMAGNSWLTRPVAGQLRIEEGPDTGFSAYRAEDGVSYIGAQEPIRLYPSGSPHENERWAFALMMPEENYRTYLNENNALLYGTILGLLALSLLLALFISKRYISPVVKAFALIKSDQRQDLQKTNIAEIDDLLDFLAEQDRQRETLQAEQEASAPNLAAYEEFVRNIGTLSAAEKAVFDLYMKGHSVEEISEKLNITTNTIKTHNRRIYNKLNVTSRKELMVYVQMMKEDSRK